MPQSPPEKTEKKARRILANHGIRDEATIQRLLKQQNWGLDENVALADLEKDAQAYRSREAAKSKRPLARLEAKAQRQARKAHTQTERLSYRAAVKGQVESLAFVAERTLPLSLLLKPPGPPLAASGLRLPWKRLAALWNETHPGQPTTPERLRARWNYARRNQEAVSWFLLGLCRDLQAAVPQAQAHLTALEQAFAPRDAGAISPRLTWRRRRGVSPAEQRRRYAKYRREVKKQRVNLSLQAQTLPRVKLLVSRLVFGGDQPLRPLAPPAAPISPPQAPEMPASWPRPRRNARG
jgi:hypothetical protein